jgi:hypothetical protein
MHGTQPQLLCRALTLVARFAAAHVQAGEAVVGTAGAAKHALVDVPLGVAKEAAGYDVYVKRGDEEHSEGLLGKVCGWACWAGCVAGPAGQGVWLGLLGKVCGWACWAGHAASLPACLGAAWPLPAWPLPAWPLPTEDCLAA